MTALERYREAILRCATSPECQRHAARRLGAAWAQESLIVLKKALGKGQRARRCRCVR